jgi:hypothetical protein
VSDWVFIKKLLRRLRFLMGLSTAGPDCVYCRAIATRIRSSAER